MADTAGMNGTVSAGYFRPVASFVCDLLFIVLAASILTLAWAAQRLGVLPDTSAHLVALFEAGLAMPDPLPVTALGYAIASASPLLGHRSIGQWLFGLELTRVQR